MKHKIYQIICVILIVIAIFLFGLIMYKYKNRQKNEGEIKEALEILSNQVDSVETSVVVSDNTNKIIDNKEEQDLSKKNVENTEIKIHGYNILGIINIPKIKIEYPILAIETSNPEATKEPMKFSVVRYWGDSVNDFGNISIAGHNNYDGTMFGKTKNLEVGDIVKLTDLKKQTITYQIYHKFVTNPDDISVLATNNQDVKEVTLITCTNGNKKRLILKARETN